MTHKQFISALTPPDDLTGPSYWFIFAGSNVLVHENRATMTIPILEDPTELGLSPLRQQFLGTLAGQACYSIEVTPDTNPPDGMSFKNLRAIFGRVDEDMASVAGRAVQIVDWDRNHQFCGRCGAKTEMQQSERGRQCPECGLVSYPRLSPSMIVRIRHGDQILLARNRHWATGFYSVLAGFVEPGETVEETVQREIREEVGIRVKNISYFSSQPWPFPNSLMLAFTAEYASGELQIDPDELEDAQWFSIDNLPRLPPPISIARRLIDSFIAEVRKNVND